MVFAVAAFFAGRESVRESVRDEIKPTPAGQEGVDYLIHTNQIRLATKRDGDKWLKLAMSPTSNAAKRLQGEIQRGSAYFVNRKIILPDDLAGANSCSFIIPTDITFPSGPRGHSRFYVMDGSAYGF